MLTGKNSNVSFFTYVAGNFLNGTIPNEASLFTSMAVFDVSENFISGSIPSILPELLSLQTYRCARNSLSGSIPTNIGLMSWLKEFSVSVSGLFCCSSS